MGIIFQSAGDGEGMSWLLFVFKSSDSNGLAADSDDAVKLPGQHGFPCGSTLTVGYGLLLRAVDHVDAKWRLGWIIAWGDIKAVTRNQAPKTTDPEAHDADLDLFFEFEAFGLEWSCLH